MCTDPSTTISCFVWNAQSLVNKVDEVIQLLLDNHADVVCITETWLSNENSVTTYAIKESGYEIDHVYRNKRGGGVAILWKSHINVKCNLKSKSYQSFQYKNIWLGGTVKINFICIYRLQEISVSQFMDDLENLLSIQSSQADTVILTGDFNFHYEKSDSKNVETLSNLTSSYGLFQFVVGPSHKLGHTLDLVFANRHELDLPFIQPTNYIISDHFALEFKLPIFNNIKKSTGKQIHYRNIKSVNRAEFSQNLCNSLDHKLKCITNNDVDFYNHSKIFSECALEQLDKVAPVKTKSLSNTSQPPWMDAEYRRERALRRSLEKSWKTSGVSENKLPYLLQRNKCARLAFSKRTQFFSNLIQKSDGDQRALFNVVSTMMDKRKISGILPHFESPKILANKFNNFYSNKVLQIRNKIKPSNLMSDYRRNFSGVIMESFMPTTVDELRKIIKEMGIKTSSQDVLPGSVLKDIIEDLLPYLCDLVNKSLNTGSVEGIKDSVIIPLLKKSGIDPEILKNYRPVTNVEWISKCIEKVISIRLYEHMSINNIHSKYQHGYKKYHSTETLLLKLSNDILFGFESNKATILLLIDLSAAFDTVDIDKLLHILENDIGIRGTALIWFKSFLVGRTQRVKIEDVLSEFLQVLFGVPQGTVLGPVLFNIYASSLSLVIKNCAFDTCGYADDNSAYKSFALTFQYNVITKNLSDLVNQINEWMNLYFLKMNPDKTEIIMFLPPNLKDRNSINGCIFSDGTCIRFSDYVKNLGVILDQHLNMDIHVNSVVSHCYKLLSDIGKIRNILSNKHIEMLVHAVISSRLDYCNSLLYGINKTVINKYQKVQNAAARLISKRRKCNSVSDVIVDLHWLKVEARIIFKLLVFIYKCINDMAPECIEDMIVMKDNVKCLLMYKNYQTLQGRKSFSYIAPKLWNNLPEEMRFSNTLLKFKKEIKYLLFNHFNNYMNSVFKYN